MCIRQFQFKVQMYFNNQDQKEKKFQNPVDPAGPDCYRIDTKPCESLQQCKADGSVTRSQPNLWTGITSGN